MWLMVIASELTALVEGIGFAMDVSRLKLGFTAIPWGTSLSDFLTCAAIARSGEEKTALMAILTNPLLDNLLGFGLALTRAALRGGRVISQSYFGSSIAESLQRPLLDGLACTAVAVSLLVGALCRRGRNVRLWVAALLSCYAVFLVKTVLLPVNANPPAAA